MARRLFEQGLEISQRLARANPGNTQSQRDLVIGYAKLGIWWRKALEIAEQLNRGGQLAPADTWMIDGLRQKSSGDR
jgi:hypothetical protein